MKDLRFKIVVLIIIIWFFEGVLRIAIGNYGKIITEGILIAGGIHALVSKKTLSKQGMMLITCLLCSLLWIALSCMALGVPVFKGLSYYRQLFWIIGFILLLEEKPFTDAEAYFLFKLCFFLIILQIVLSCIYYILGHREEYIVGTLCSTGGELATVFTLIGLSFMIGAGVFVNKIYLFLFPSAFMIGLASEKRAIFVFVPVFVSLLFLVIRYKLRSCQDRSIKQFNKALRILFLVVIVILPFVPYFINQVKFEINDVDLNRANLTEYLYEVLSNYATGTGKEYETVEGDSASRIQNLKTGMEKSFENPEMFFWGIGADAFQVSDYDTKKLQLGMYYGIVGIVDDALSNGMPFAILILLFFFLLTKTVSKISFDSLSPWGRASLASYYGFLLSFVIVHFLYGHSFVQSPLVLCIMILYPELLKSIDHPADQNSEITSGQQVLSTP